MPQNQEGELASTCAGMSSVSLGQDCHTFPYPQSLEFHRHKGKIEGNLRGDLNQQGRQSHQTADHQPVWVSAKDLQMSHAAELNVASDQRFSHLLHSLLHWKDITRHQESLDGSLLIICLLESQVFATWRTKTTHGVHQVHLMVREPGIQTPSQDLRGRLASSSHSKARGTQLS